MRRAERKLCAICVTLGLIIGLLVPVSVRADDLAVDCDEPSFVLADSLLLRTWSGLYERTGTGWSRVPTPIYDFYTGIALSSDGTIYLLHSTPDLLYRSRNRGSTWDLITDVIPSGERPTHIFPSPLSDMVFAGAVDGPPPSSVQGVYKSIDGGSVWRKVLDGGSGSGFGNGRWVAFSPNFAQDGVAFAVLDDYKTSLGAWRTSDWGESWVAVSEGLYVGPTMTPHRWVVLSPQFVSDRTAFTAASGGIYVTGNGGDTWSMISASSISYPLALSPDFSADHLLAGSSFNTTWVSLDAGRSWRLAHTSWHERVVGIRRAAPGGQTNALQAGSEIWLVSSQDYTQGCRLYVSTDFGQTWRKELVSEAVTQAFLPLASR